MDLDKVMIVAGIGCRKGTSAADVEAVIAAALARAGLPPSALSAVATSCAKHDEVGIAAAAATLGVPLRLVAEHDLAEAAARVVTRSARVLELAGVPSVAEASALAAAVATSGTSVVMAKAPDTPHTPATGNTFARAPRLVLARIVLGPATCALAETGDIP